MELIIILILILLNGFLSMCEISIVSSRKARLEADLKKGKKSAQKVLELMDKPDGFLSTIQIGITLIGILTGLFSGEKIASDFAAWIGHIPALAVYSGVIAKTLIVIMVTYLTLVLGELLPKRIGMRNPEKVASGIAGIMNALSTITYPFVWILSKSTRALLALLGMKENEESKVTEEEIKAMIEESAEDGEIEEVEQDIVGRVFNLGDRNVGSVMTHRSELIWIDIQDEIESIKKLIYDNPHDVFPVASEQLDEIQGVIYLKDIFGKTEDPNFDLRSFVRPAIFFPENMSVYNSLEQLKKQYSKYALVTDEFGGVQGIVTVADILEALIGELPDNQEEEMIVGREDGSFLIDGQCPLYHFLEFFDLDNEEGDYPFNTLGGLILDQLEHIPATGEKLIWHNLEMEIVDMDRARIDKVLVKSISQD